MVERQTDNFVIKWTLRMTIVFLLLLVLIFGVGMLLPASFKSSAMVARSKVSPEQFWSALNDPTLCPLSTDPTCKVVLQPDVNGLPAWQEHIRGAVINVQVTELVEGERIVWTLSDNVAPIKTTWSAKLEPQSGGGARVSIEEVGSVAGGSLQTPIFRWAMFTMGGWGPGEYLNRLATVAGK